MTLQFTVHGTPAPQGSKRGFYNPKLGRVQMVESSKKVKPWRQDVKHAALQANGDTLPLVGPVTVVIDFFFPRPKSHFGSGRNAHILKANAPGRPVTKPDIDKVTRSTLDALTEAFVYGDDSQVTTLMVTKQYADRRAPGADLKVFTPVPPALPQQPAPLAQEQGTLL